MLVFVETTSGSMFSIKLNSKDRVLDIKKKIEKSQGIAVSAQDLYYNGEALLINDVDLRICNITNHSHLFLVLPDDDNYRMLPRTEQAPAPSHYITNIEDSLGKNQRQMLHQTKHSQVLPSNELEAFFNTYWSPMARNNDDKPEKSQLNSCSTDELLDFVQDMRKLQDFWPAGKPEGDVNIQESSGRNDNNQDFWPAGKTEGDVNTQESSGSNDYNQDLLQREPHSTSNTFGNFSFGEDRSLSTERFTNIKSTTEEIIYKNQTEQCTVPSNPYGDFSFIEFPLSAERHNDISYFPDITIGVEDIINENQVLQTGQTPVPSNLTEQRINTQDLPVKVGSSNQVVQTEKSPPIREVNNIPDSPVKVRSFKKLPQMLRVMVLPYSSDSKHVRKFPVNVNARENVEELRKELEKIQEKTELNLPKEGYFFVHKQRVLDDDQSFLWNDVAHGDTIEIFLGYVTKG